jgi:hypothetical protein
MNKPTLYFLRMFFVSQPNACILAITDSANPFKPKDLAYGKAGFDRLFANVPAWMEGCFSRQATQG